MHPFCILCFVKLFRKNEAGGEMSDIRNGGPLQSTAGTIDTDSGFLISGQYHLSAHGSASCAARCVEP